MASYAGFAKEVKSFKLSEGAWDLEMEEEEEEEEEEIEFSNFVETLEFYERGGEDFDQGKGEGGELLAN